MSEQNKGFKAVLDMLKMAEQQGMVMSALIDVMPASFRPFMDEAITLFEQQPTISQLTAMAMMFGQCGASLEGEVVPAELKHGQLITFEDRLELFCVEARAVYKEALGFQQSSENPHKTGVM